MSQTNQQLPQSIELSINTRRLAKIVLIVCLLVEIAFLLLDYYVNFSEYTDIGALQRLFNITQEDGLASWFASTQTLLVGISFGFIYCCVRQQSGKQREAIGWLVLTCFFIYMAIDDGAMLHERLSTTFRKSLAQSDMSLDFFPSYTWQLIFLPIFSAFGIFIFYFLWFQFSNQNSRKLLILVMSCFALAVGLDFIEGLEAEHPLNFYTWIGDNTDLDYWTIEQFDENAYQTLLHFSKSLEETLEMFAHTLIWYLLLQQIHTLIPSVSINFTEQ